jgi:2-polyprenyl-3-methyl-5-hydroxy-6-metoxy-1,4-benzoquinol methylase
VNIDYALSREKRLDFRYRLKRRTHEVLLAIGRYVPCPQNIVDLGTAEGKMLWEVKRKYPASWCLGVDCSLPLLVFGRRRYPEVSMVCADVQNLAFLKSETFDLVVAAAVIEHLFSPQQMLKESVRLLRQGGILIVTTPHPFWEKISGVLGWVRGDHHSVMPPQDLVDLCRRERLIIREDYGFMISPVGLWGEKGIEAVLRKMRVDRFLPNHLVVAQKWERGTGPKDEDHTIPD